MLVMPSRIWILDGILELPANTSLVRHACKALPRECEIRERGAECCIVRINAIAKLAGKCVRNEARVEQRIRCARDCLDGDIHDIVTEATAVRISLGVATQYAHAVRLRGRCDSD